MTRIGKKNTFTQESEKKNTFMINVLRYQQCIEQYGLLIIH